MTLYQIKPLFQSLLRPTMFWLYKHHVTSPPFLSGNRHSRKRFISVAKINNAKSVARDFSSIIFQHS